MTEEQQGFDGVERLYGVDDYTAIRKAHICVVGIGGVGTWVAEALARSGVGQITCNSDRAACSQSGGAASCALV